DAFSDFLPYLIRRNWRTRKPGAPSIRFRLKTQHWPYSGPTRIGQVPFKYLRNIIDIAFGNGATERVFERAAGFLPDPQCQISERLPQWMEINFGRYPLDRKTMPA